MSFANPLGLLGLLALPAILALHLYHRRFPTLLVGGLHLWGVHSEIRQPGRRRDRLPITASLLLELLAATILSLVLGEPRLSEAQRVEHLVVVLDDSASMQARPPGGQSFREAAAEEIEHRFADLPKGSVATLLVTGRRPSLLAGPAVELTQARAALAAWQPGASAHDFQPAWDLATQLAADSGRILFLTDHLPPKELAVPKRMQTVSVGRSLENTAITASRWTFDSKANRGHVFLRVANYGKHPATVSVRGLKGDKRLFERSISLEPKGDAALETEVAGGLQEITVETSAPADGLSVDNRCTLVEPKVRTVNVAVTLPADHSATQPVRRALSGVADLQTTSAADARLIVAPAAQLPPSREDLWWLGIGPLDRSETARKKAKDIVGPYLIEKKNPLLDGVLLDGVVLGGVQPFSLDATPLVSTGRQFLLARLNGSSTSAYVLDADFARSNLADSPDWPILIKNLADLCRDSLPGLKRWNYRLNEEVIFRLDPTARERTAPLTLQFRPTGHPDETPRSRTLPRSSVIAISSLDQAGIYEIRDGDRPLGRFAVNFQDAVESDLVALGPGVRNAALEAPLFAYRLDDPFSWLIAAGLLAIVACVLADWFMVRKPKG